MGPGQGSGCQASWRRFTDDNGRLNGPAPLVAPLLPTPCPVGGREPSTQIGGCRWGAPWFARAFAPADALALDGSGSCRRPRRLAAMAAGRAQ
jgi:hypothetical protein